MNLSMHTIILLYTTRNYSRSWVHWRHCRAAAGSCIIVIRWRPWLHWTGCFSCQRSSVQWTHARCVSVTSDLSSVFNEKLLADPAVGDSFSEIKLKVRREALRLLHFTKLNLNFVKPLERVLCLVCWWANCTIAVSSAPTFQHEPLQQPSPTTAAVTTTPGGAVGAMASSSSSHDHRIQKIIWILLCNQSQIHYFNSCASWIHSLI